MAARTSTRPARTIGGEILFWVALGAAFIFFMFPLYWMLVTSFKARTIVEDRVPAFIPFVDFQPTTINYLAVFTKVSELAYSEPRLAALLQSTDCIRYSTTQGTNALVQRAGPQLGLLVTDPTLVEGLAATQAQEDLLAALVGDRWGRISLDADDEALGRELLARVNDLSARGARRLVIAVSGADGADGEARVKGLLLRLYPRHLLGAVPLLFSWELIADPDDKEGSL